VLNMEAVDISSDPVSNLMNKTGIMFIVSGILTIIFSLLDVFVLSYLGIVSNLILIISIIMLGIVMKKIPESFPLSDPEASTAGYLNLFLFQIQRHLQQEHGCLFLLDVKYFQLYSIIL
ncbi:MAG: hypothetical protein ACTSRO_04715, partial [Candidatus Heimdallarchaeaceae archaeon]